MKILIINKSHSVLPQQIEILGDFERFDLPDTGATLKMVQGSYLESFEEFYFKGYDIVFATPFAALMVTLQNAGIPFSCLHNDKRIAQEIPDGKGGVKVIHTVSPDGWVIVE